MLLSMTDSFNLANLSKTFQGFILKAAPTSFKSSSECAIPGHGLLTDLTSVINISQPFSVFLETFVRMRKTEYEMTELDQLQYEDFEYLDEFARRNPNFKYVRNVPKHSQT